MKVVLIIIIVASVTLLLGVGAAGYLAWKSISPASPPTPSAPPTPAPSPAPTPPPQPTSSFEEKIKSLEQTVALVQSSGKSQETTLNFTEAEVNEQAAKMLTQIQMPADMPLKLTGVRIDLKPDNILSADLESTAYGFKVTIKVKAQVSIKEGKPEVKTTEISFGAMPLPQAIKDQVASLIAKSINDVVTQMTQTGISGAGVTLELKSITIQENDLTITAIIKPRA